MEVSNRTKLFSFYYMTKGHHLSCWCPVTPFWIKHEGRRDKGDKSGAKAASTAIQKGV